MRLSCVFAQQAVAVLHRAAAFADLPQGLQFPDGREVVLPRVAQGRAKRGLAIDEHAQGGELGRRGAVDDDAQCGAGR